MCISKKSEFRSQKSEWKRLARLIRSRKLSATEVMKAFIAQIEHVNPKVNAIVTFLPEEAIKAAKAMDRKNGRRGMLAGLAEERNASP